MVQCCALFSPSLTTCMANLAVFCRGSGSCILIITLIFKLNGVTSISAGEFHAVAIKRRALCTSGGYNKDGQLGNGSTSNR